MYEVEEYATTLEDLLIAAKPTFEEIKRLADRAGIPYHAPSTVPTGIHDLVQEATRNPLLLDRLFTHIPAVLPNISATALQRHRDGRPESLRPISDGHPGADPAPEGPPGDLDQGPPQPRVRPELDGAVSALSAGSSAVQGTPAQRSRGTRPRRLSESNRAAWIGGWFALATAIVGALLTVFFTNVFGTH